MNVYITVDHELFFGRRAGTVERCMLAPGDALLALADRTGARLTFFVDAGHLAALKRHMGRFAALRRDYDALVDQLRRMVGAGHDIQLHVHPHWEDSRYDGGEWRMDLSRFALAQFTDDDVVRLVTDYKAALEEVTEEPLFAYRAGGWCLQPFKAIGSALKRNGVWLDSTVFPGGHMASSGARYDFRAAPDRDGWRFETDPCREEPAGYFLELPIASVAVPPRFYWKLAAVRKFGRRDHQPFGDGSLVPIGTGSLLAKLARTTRSTVSFDGYKASLLDDALHAAERDPARQHFVVIGHTKSLTPYGLARMERFILANRRRHHYVSITDIFGVRGGARSLEA